MVIGFNSEAAVKQLHDRSTRASAHGGAGSFAGIARLALCFGIVTGLVEGIGLLAFQHVNWERWGPMIHVSLPIIWISPLVDVGLFLLAGIVVWLVARIAKPSQALHLAVFLLTFLAVYDWLALTGRLYRLACMVLAIGFAVAMTRWSLSNQNRISRILRKSMPVLVGLLAVAFVGIEGSNWWIERAGTAALRNAPAGTPNILVLVIDTLRADHVSAYGYSRPTTPNIDRLVRGGVLFDNAIAASSWSLPSHVSLVTGRYLHDHGVGNVEREPWLGWGKAGLNGLPTIGEALEQQGYRTGAFSANRTYFSHDLGFGRGFLHFEDYFNSIPDALVRTVYGREFSRIYLKRSNKSLVKRVLRGLGWNWFLDQDAEGSGSYGGAFGIRKHADQVNQEVLSWIDHDRQHPFFAFLNYFDVHDPYGGPSNYKKPSWTQKSDIDWYDDGVKYTDDCLGRLMEALQSRGLTSNTLVIVTSDHGESLGQHFLMTHGRVLYRELIHVPLVIWYPAKVPSGVREESPVSNAAIPATILDLVGAASASFGYGLDKFWQPGSHASADPLSELAQNKYSGKHDEAADKLIPTATTGSMQSIVTPQWHLILHHTLGAQLYDWVNDPGELHNLIDSPEGKVEAQKLEFEMKADKVP